MCNRLLDVSPSYLSSLYKNRRTIQADDLVSGYVGKCIKVIGTITDITRPSDILLVSIRDHEGSRIIARFMAGISEKVSHVPSNATIIVHGILNYVTIDYVSILACDLEVTIQN